MTELIGTIIRIIFELILYEIGYYTVKIITFGKYKRKKETEFFEIMYFDAIGILVIFGIFYGIAQL